MKQLYIRITKEQTEKIAVDKAKKLWYEEEGLYFFNEREFILLKSNWDFFYTKWNEKELKDNWFEELIIEDLIS